MAKMQDAGFVSSLKGMTAAQLMDMKDSIEKEIKEFNDVLEGVRIFTSIPTHL